MEIAVGIFFLYSDVLGTKLMRSVKQPHIFSIFFINNINKSNKLQFISFLGGGCIC